MNAKEQKKEILRIINNNYIPSMVFTFDKENYYLTADVIENADKTKQLIKEL